jgi:hypothetical protein
MPRKGPHRYGEYERAHRKDTQLRVEARRMMEKKVGKAALAGKDVDHVKPIRKGGGNSPGNLRLRDPSKNRGDNK